MCWSRFKNRVYSFEGEKRGQRFNRGVDPGSPVSVFLFKLFMNTDVSLSGLNENLIWAAAYSDDRAPIIPADDFVDGSAQFIWKESENWTKENKVEYHVEKDDKKRHAFMEYKKKNMQHTDEMDNLTLANEKFTRKNKERELGLNVSTGGGKLRTFANFEPCEKNFGQKFFFRTFELLNSAKVRK